MSNNDRATLIVDADLSPYEAKFAQIPGYTEEQARKAAAGFVRATNEGQVKAALRAEMGAKKAASAWEGLAKAAKASGFGGLVEKIQNMSGALEALGPEALAAGAALAALAATAVGVYAVSKAVIEAAYNTAELSQKLDHLNGIAGFEPIPPEQIQASQQLNIDLQAMSDIWSDIVREVGGRAAPALAMASRYVVELGLAVRDTNKAWIEFQDWHFENALKLLTKTDYYEQAKNLEAAIVGQGLAANFAKQAIEGLSGAHDLVAKAEKADAEAAREAQRAREKADQERATNYEDAARRQAALDQMLGQARTAVDGDAEAAAESLNKVRAWAHDEEMKAIRAEQAAQKAADAQAIQDAKNLTAARIGLIGNLLQAGAELVEANIAGTKKGEMYAFRAQQASAIAAIAISTIQADMQALAELGPVAGGIAAAGITALGAAQAAAVAAQKPPKFHTGSSAPFDPDEGPVTLRRGETVNNERATQNNAAAIAEMNRTGRLPNDGGTAYFFDGRFAGLVTRAGLARAEVRDALRRASATGRRAGYAA